MRVRGTIVTSKRTTTGLLLAAAAAALFGAASARAQAEAVTLSELVIRVWPEYDQPSVLVLYHGQVGEDTPLPVELRFALPPDAAFHAAAYYDAATDDLLNAPHVLEDGGIVMSSPNGTFHIEFYDPALQIDGEQRSYTLTWEGDYAVQQLTWEVQQPPAARSFSVDPTGGTLAVGENGLAYYSVSQTEMAADETAALSLSYLNPEGALTRDLTPEQEPGRTIWPVWVAAGMAVLGIGVGIGAYLYARKCARDAKEAESTPGAELADETPLTERELEVLALVAEGLNNKEIGERLGISPKTVARHRENIMAKVGVHNRIELAMYAVKIGLVDIESE
jgi:DNA-binding NarL/FixJ family response regulator